MGSETSGVEFRPKFHRLFSNKWPKFPYVPVWQLARHKWCHYGSRSDHLVIEQGYWRTPLSAITAWRLTLTEWASSINHIINQRAAGSLPSPSPWWYPHHSPPMHQQIRTAHTLLDPVPYITCECAAGAFLIVSGPSLVAGNFAGNTDQW